MEFDKTARVAAPIERVWQRLLDPRTMADCVPGIQSIEVIDPTEYLVGMEVKISFITARFRIRTRILEARAPEYLRSEGAGEDSRVLNSFKQASELFLSQPAAGETEVRMKLKVEFFGQFGNFGLNIIKTKADRMWEEFARSFAQRAGQQTHQPQGETS